MPEANESLRQARENVESPNGSGEPLTRQELAELVNEWVYRNAGSERGADIDANYVGKLEQGKIRWPQDANRRAALRALLGVDTDSELGFKRPRRTRSQSPQLTRRNFVVGVGAASAASAGALDILTLTEEISVPSQVGRHEVEEVRAAATAFRAWDARYGGGFVRAAVMAQLRYAVQLLNARVSERNRAELFSAVGYLGHVVGFMAFDACEYDDAHRMFRFAQSCAEETGDWHLRAKILSSMARLAIWRNDPDSGLTFAELALVRPDRLTATERAMLHTTRARALGKLHRVQETVSSVGQADQAFSHADPACDSPWMAYYDAAQHAGDTGHALWELAVQGRFVTDANTRLAESVNQHDDGAARSRAFSQTKLASLMMATSDPAYAAELGHQALDAATPIRSHRIAMDLQVLSSYAQEHQRHDGVAELRRRITSAVATV